ncbi:CRISPR-associated RAMP protein, Cmr4 family [Thiorhodococcus drewsii AZ1]|uniref:CRISPR-associated RAMP protein, Cmr4 family n=1 Tax=Thiorhodococcus drewsii AZ1 TaxID=765913 RepID=G2DYK5_9GAMM|nr:type III-B CRISPR module RAMP protein Cmr4 [Thiorhodococcus drewsii]EGV32632.1 CRISPR-associated RAMP protein, Cmr4 family [Thiorhodococcus drewsii AZ1]
MNTSALLGLLAETSIHAGAGQSGGVVDLPIQREAHTGWPVVYGSAVKGALRALAEENTEKNAPWLTAVFGPETNNASDHAGALLVGDARLLLLPVRSLTGHFKWVTCPALLRRFAADAARLGLTAFDLPAAFARLDRQTVLLPEPTGESLYLEEFRLRTEQADFETIIPVLASLMDRFDAETALRKQLALVDDDRFSHLAQFATPVNAHVCIDNRTKTVKPGALWYEESLPPDTLLYVALHAQAARRKEADKSAAEVLAHVTGDLFGQRPYLQLGGNETVGMGWCKVSVQHGEG